MVFWYGSKEGSLESYSLLPQSEIISYEDGKERYGEIPHQLEEKLNLEEDITEYEGLKIRGLNLMRSDAKKEKKDRKSHWIFKFSEDNVLSHWGDVLRSEKSIVSNNNHEEILVTRGDGKAPIKNLEKTVQVRDAPVKKQVNMSKAIEWQQKSTPAVKMGGKSTSESIQSKGSRQENDTTK